MTKARFCRVYFGENMIICVINDTDKMWIFLIGARLFIHLNVQYVLNRLYVNDTSLPTKHSVRFVISGDCLHDAAIFVLL